MAVQSLVLLSQLSFILVIIGALHMAHTNKSVLTPANFLMKTALRNHHLMEPCYRWYEYDPKEKPYKSLALINYSQCTHVIVSLINDKTSRNTVIDIPEDFPVQIKSILAQDGPHGDKKPFYFFRVSASQYMGHVRQQLIDEGYGDHLIHPTNDDFGANKSPYQNSPFEQITALIQQAHISHFDGLEFEILPIFPDNQPDKYYYLIYDAEFDFIMAKISQIAVQVKEAQLKCSFYVTDPQVLLRWDLTSEQIDGLDYVGINFGPPTSLVPFFVTTDTNFPLHWWVPHNYNVGALLYVLNAKFGFKIIALYNKYPERIYFDDLADDVKATDQFKEFKSKFNNFCDSSRIKIFKTCPFTFKLLFCKRNKLFVHDDTRLYRRLAHISGLLGVSGIRRASSKSKV